MGQIGDKERILSADKAEQESDDGGNDGIKLVPVGESIRYRRRAQSAEKKAETLAEQLMQATQEAREMAEELNRTKTEQELTRKLVAERVEDLEAAVLIAKARIEDEPEADLNGVIEQLKKDKQYLFSGSSSGRFDTTAQRTAAAKDRVTNKQIILEGAAKKAATTGNRTDLQEYLKLRRNFI
ncbi:MAG: hypothetical protein ACYS8Y_09250 [Planctomycetota bacterium]|jgi:hypothetical protein